MCTAGTSDVAELCQCEERATPFLLAPFALAFRWPALALDTRLAFPARTFIYCRTLSGRTSAQFWLFLHTAARAGAEWITPRRRRRDNKVHAARNPKRHVVLALRYQIVPS